MTDNLNLHGNHQGEFTQGVGGWAEYTVYMTDVKDTIRHDVKVPPGKVIPVIFLPGVMGSNLRLSAARQPLLDRPDQPDNRSWRPDDIDKIDVMRETGFGGWFRNATPAQRQLNFDPNETEVEYYHYTENKERFDPQGAVTKASDARHQNVFDALGPIPPLMGSIPVFPSVPSADKAAKPRIFATAAQVARWRGWSEVRFGGAYGTMLKTAERFLNNIVRDGVITPFLARAAKEFPRPTAVDYAISNHHPSPDERPEGIRRDGRGGHYRGRSEDHRAMLVSGACDGLSLY